jgi:hypothetical protein
MFAFYVMTKDEKMNFGTGALSALVGPMLHAVAMTPLKIMFVITVVNQTR